MDCKLNTLHSSLVVCFLGRHAFTSSTAVFPCKRVLFHSNFVFKLDTCYFRNHMNSAAATNSQPVLLHIKHSAVLNSQLAAGLWSLFSPNYVPAWIIVLLKLLNYFVNLLSRLPLFSISYERRTWSFFCLFHALACFHTYFKVLLSASAMSVLLPLSSHGDECRGCTTSSLWLRTWSFLPFESQHLVH